MEYRYSTGQHEGIQVVQIERVGAQFEITIGDRTYRVDQVQSLPGELHFEINGQHFHLYTAQDRGRQYIALGSDVYALQKVDPKRRKPISAAENNLTAAMPGQVVIVQVREGEQVEKGQLLVTLEAMKMEIRVTAPHAGTVTRLHCQVGQIVERGQVLLELA